MNRDLLFNEAYAALERRLASMSGEDFFSMFGISIDELPSLCQESPVRRLDAVPRRPTSSSRLDLKCA